MTEEYLRVGNVCGEKIEYKDGVGYCVWHPLDEDPSSGVCWDFVDIDGLIDLLQQLKVAEAQPYEEE